MEHLYFIFQNIWNRIGNVRQSDSARCRGRGVIWIFPILITALFFISISHAEIKAKDEVNKDDSAKSQAQVTYGNLPLYFIQNDGQLDRKVKFYEKGSGHVTYFTKKGVYISLVSNKQEADGGGKPSLHSHSIEASNPSSPNPDVAADFSLRPPQTPSPSSLIGGVSGRGEVTPAKASERENITSDFIHLTFLDANPDPEIFAEGLQEGKVNYFVGNDPAKWRTNIPTYGAVVYKEVYPGIDVKFYGNNHQLEYDIFVKPGADPFKVGFSYMGIKGLNVTEEGDLLIELKEGILLQKKPVIYQEIGGKRVNVAGNFKLLNPKSNIDNPELAYSFEVASYDKTHPLIIDPTLVYSTYLGGSDVDMGLSIAVDTSGNAYITGYTRSLNFPTSSPIYEMGISDSQDAFVTKINASGSSLVYSTYIGGNNNGEVGQGIAVDSSGNAYITGRTQSTDFPIASPIYGTLSGVQDAFVTKIDASGSSLVYSTYLGGSAGEIGYGIAVDDSENAYITGDTSSTDFPIASAIQGSYAGGYSDAFVVEFHLYSPPQFQFYSPLFLC